MISSQQLNECSYLPRTDLSTPRAISTRYNSHTKTTITMSSGGAVQMVDLAQCPTPDSLAEAIKSAMQTQGFLFMLNHGLEKQAEELFKISGALLRPALLRTR